MNMEHIGPLQLSAAIERWPLVEPFRISGYTFESVEVLVVSLECDGRVGRGEAAGVYYRNDGPTGMLQQIESLRAVIEAGIDRQTVQTLLGPCGARNALDCALWELEARLTQQPVWRMAGLDRPLRPLLTTFTCGADEPARMAQRALAYPGARAIKLKLTGDPIDAERVRAVRAALPDVWLSVDANQGFTRASLEGLMPVLTDARVQLIEQPFAVGEDALLDGFDSPIPVAADESLQSLMDLPQLAGRFNVVNIKLDKSGGLTEGLAIARRARAFGMELMVGNMMNTSLAMAPAFVVGQLCSVVDLDGPLFLKSDRPHPMRYENGYVSCPEMLWGG